MSEKVFLVRHARAEAQSKEGDVARELTPAGRVTFEAHVRTLRAMLIVDRVVTSPMLRARETAQILAQVTGARVALDPQLSAGNCDGRALLALALRLGAGVALVGHNPEFAQAVSSVAGHRVDLAPGGIAALEFTPRGLELAWLRLPV